MYSFSVVKPGEQKEILPQNKKKNKRDTENEKLRSHYEIRTPTPKLPFFFFLSLKMETVNTHPVLRGFFLTRDTTMETLMRSTCNYSLLIKSQSSNYTQAQWPPHLSEFILHGANSVLPLHGFPSPSSFHTIPSILFWIY